MGISSSGDMLRNEDEESVSDDGSENESDLASILQFLIRSGQVRILGTDHSYLSSSSRAVRNCGSNLDNFRKSEMCYMTKKYSGTAANDKKTSVTELIRKREFGSSLGFSKSERCWMSNSKLPNNNRIIDTYECKAFSGIYSHDGNLLLTASQDRFLRLYDTSSSTVFKKVKRILGRDVGWSVLSTAFSPDDRKFAYSSWASSLYIVDVNETNLHSSLDLDPYERRFSVFSLQFSSDGQEILCGANDGHIYIYDLGANERIFRVEAHSDDLNTVAFADNTSQILYSGGDDGLCKVWDRRTMSDCNPRPVGVLAGHLDGVVYIDSRGDARHFISNSKDQSIKLWDIRILSTNAAQDNTRRAVGMNKWDYRWQNAPKKLYTRKTNLKGDTSLATFRGHSVLQTQIRCHFSPQFTTGQRFIYTGCAFGRIIAYDLLTGEVAMKLEGHSSCVRDVSWHPYRTEIVSSSWDFSVVCWNNLIDPEDEPFHSKDEARIHGDDDEDDDEEEEEEDREVEAKTKLRRSRRIADMKKTKQK